MEFSSKSLAQTLYDDRELVIIKWYYNSNEDCNCGECSTGEGISIVKLKDVLDKHCFPIKDDLGHDQVTIDQCFDLLGSEDYLEDIDIHCEYYIHTPYDKYFIESYKISDKGYEYLAPPKFEEYGKSLYNDIIPFDYTLSSDKWILNHVFNNPYQQYGLNIQIPSATNPNNIIDYLTDKIKKLDRGSK